MVKDAEKISAQFSVSINDATKLVTSWLSQDNTESTSDESSSQENVFKPMWSSRAGLGSQRNTEKESSNGTEGITNAYTAKALESLKRKMSKSNNGSPNSSILTSTKTQDSADSEEDSKNLVRKKMNKSTGSFYDAYKSKKKNKKR